MKAKVNQHLLQLFCIPCNFFALYAKYFLAICSYI